MSKNNNGLDKPKIMIIIIFLIIFGGPFAIIGVGILIWYLSANAKANREKEAAQAEEEARRERAMDERVWRCERCGANTKGRICEYCDSPYEG